MNVAVQQFEMVADETPYYIGDLERWGVSYASPDGGEISLEASWDREGAIWIPYVGPIATGAVVSNPPNGSTMKNTIHPLWIRASEDVAGTHTILLTGSRDNA